MLSSERRYLFSARPEAVWAAMGQVGRFRSWWPWLKAFEGQGLFPGDRWTCQIRPPLPYSLRFVVELVELVPAQHLRATLSGDVVGEASLELTADPAGCSLRLSSNLVPTRTALRLTSRLAGPLVERAHARVLDTGADQFARQAL